MGELVDEHVTSFSCLPHHLVIKILLCLMQDASVERRQLVPDLRLLIMDLGSISRDIKGCLSSALSMVSHVNLDSGIDHRRMTGQAIPLVDDAMLAGVGRKCKKLEQLRLRCSEEVTEQGLVAVSDGCSSSLAKLAILSCSRIGSGRFLPPLSSLRHLELKWAYSLLPYHLYPILPNLVVLNLHGCELINDDLFLTHELPPSNLNDENPPSDPLPLSLPYLEELDLAYTLVTGASLQHLAKYAPRLKKLNLGGHYFNIITSSRITEAAEATFTEARSDVAITHS